MLRSSCALCLRPFATPSGRLYCSHACRRAKNQQDRERREDDRLRMLEAAHTDELLPSVRLDLIDVEPCFYCGLPADTQDHVIPQSKLGDLEALGIKTMWSQRTWDVPACLECNSALGDRLFRNINERKRWVKNWLRRRYAKYLKMPQWTEDELRELGYSLRQNVQDHIDAKQTLLMRLRW